MPVRVNIDGELIKVKIDNHFDNHKEMLAALILNDCNKYCKEDTGMLLMSSFIHSDLKKGRLVWQTPYAARQYYEIPTAYHDVNSNATWRWCEVAKNNHLSRWIKQAQAIARLYG